MEEDLRFGGVFWWVAEEEDVAIGAEAVDEAGAGRGLHAEASGAGGDATVGLDFDGGALWLKTQGHQGHLGAGRRADRFSFWARSQAASGVMANSR